MIYLPIPENATPSEPSGTAAPTVLLDINPGSFGGGSVHRLAQDIADEFEDAARKAEPGHDDTIAWAAENLRNHLECALGLVVDDAVAQAIADIENELT